MKASIVDLRYHMRDVLKALSRNEEVEIMFHRKTIGIISPAKNKSSKKVEDHPFFGMTQERGSVDEAMKKLRGGRYERDDI